MSPNTPRYPRDVSDVVRAGLCTSCGLCESIAGSDCIKMTLNSNGFMRPRVVSRVDDDVNRTIMSVCPGRTVTGPGTSSDGYTDDRWGPIRELRRSWSAEPAVRHHGAAGGTLTALGRYLLAVGEVDAVVHVKASQDIPWQTDSVVSTTPDEVMDSAQSRYGPAAPLIHVNRLLDEGKRFAVIAKPCDVTAIRALGRVDARVRTQIPYLLTIFCGGIHHVNIPRQIIRHHGVDESDVAVFRYRGDGWPGPTRVETKSGERHDISYQKTWLEPAPWTYDMQFRCKICPDAIGENGDVAAPDGWVLREGKAVHDEAPGVNATLIRTARGEELMSNAISAGYLQAASLTLEELGQMHVDHRPRKLGWPAAQAALVLLRQPHLKIRGYRLLRTLRAAGVALTNQQFTGTVKRIRRGDNHEGMG